MAKGSRFTYQRRSAEAIKDRANMKGGGFDSFLKPQYKTYKPKDGKNIIRILPPTWGQAAHYGLDLWVNYGIGVDEVSYLSLSRMKNEPDPLLEARKQADREGDEKLSKALQARQRILYWLIDRQDEDEGPQLWAAPFTFDKSVANICFDDDTKEIVYIDDPEKGWDLRFYKEGQGIKTKYDASKMKLINQGYIHEDEKLQEEWLDYITENPLTDCLQFYSYDHIAAAFDGHARTDDDGEERKPEKGTSERGERNRNMGEGDEKTSSRRSTREEPSDPDERPSRRRFSEPDEPASGRRSGTRPEPEADPEEGNGAGENTAPVERGSSIRERIAERRRRAEAGE